MENDEFRRKTNEIGYAIYEKLKNKYYKDDLESFYFIYNCLLSSFTYFIGNLVNEDRYDVFCEFAKEGIEKSVEQLKEYNEEGEKIKEEPDYLFSKELRDRMAKFNDRNLHECLQDPDFYNELLNHAGIDEETKKNYGKRLKKMD